MKTEGLQAGKKDSEYNIPNFSLPLHSFPVPSSQLLSFLSYKEPLPKSFSCSLQVGRLWTTLQIFPQTRRGLNCEVVHWASQKGYCYSSSRISLLLSSGRYHSQMLLQRKAISKIAQGEGFHSQLYFGQRDQNLFIVKEHRLWIKAHLHKCPLNLIDPLDGWLWPFHNLFDIPEDTWTRTRRRNIFFKVRY